MTNLLENIQNLESKFCFNDINPNPPKWLEDPSSITKKLKIKFNHDEIKFNVLSQKFINIDAGNLINDFYTNKNYIRKVAIVCQKRVIVLAKTIIPYVTYSTNEGKALLNVGNNSIGDILFSSPNITRKKIIPQTKIINNKIIHARRSLFYYYSSPLVLDEWFLEEI